MDAIWFPALLVLGLGLVWALLDAWWVRRRWRLERERRREALPSPTPVAASASHAGKPAPAPAAAAEPSGAMEAATEQADASDTGWWARRPQRAPEGSESDLPA